MGKNNPYTIIASQRANYYTKGSPVQFVRTELLREEATGDILVTATFKNLYQRLLTSCKINLACKNTLGQIIAQENFSYEGLAVPDSETFGADEAIFVSTEEIAAVEISLLEISFESGRVHDISNYEKIVLPPLRTLSEMMAGVMGSTLHNEDVQYRPHQFEEGWQCTCGAFNYNAGRSLSACGECGQDKAMLFSAMKSAESPNDSGTRVFQAVQEQPYNQTDYNSTRAFSSQQPRSRKTNRVSIMSDATAEFIVKFVPFIAAGASLVYVVGALLMKQLLF